MGRRKRKVTAEDDGGACLAPDQWHEERRVFLRRLAIAYLLVTLGAVLAIMVWSRDIEPPDDSHLRVEFAESKPAQRRLLSLANIDWGDDAGGDSDWSQLNDMLRGKLPWDPELSTVVLAARAPMCRQVAETLRAGPVEFPQFKPALEDALNNANRSLFRASDLLRFEAVHYAELGDRSFLLVNARKLLEMGKLLSDAPPPWLYLGSVDHAWDNAEELLWYGITTSEDIAEVVQMGDLLGGFPLPYEIYEQSLRKSYREHSRAVGQEVTREWKWNRDAPTSPEFYFFQPHRTRKKLIEITDGVLADFRKPVFLRKELKYPDLPRKGLKPWITRNRYGDEIGWWLTQQLDFRVLDRHASREVTRRALPLLAALKHYEIEVGKLPNTLSELVPGYLEALPLDPFDGQPMRYSREKGGAVYSLGSDGLKDPDWSTDAMFEPWPGNVLDEEDRVYLLRRPTNLP